jgi:hypothetical protein
VITARFVLEEARRRKSEPIPAPGGKLRWRCRGKLPDDFRGLLLANKDALVSLLTNSCPTPDSTDRTCLPTGWEVISRDEAIRVFVEAQEAFDRHHRRTCPVRDCLATILLAQVCCERHWKAIPRDARDEIERLYDGRKSRLWKSLDQTQSPEFLSFVATELRKLEYGEDHDSNGLQAEGPQAHATFDRQGHPCPAENAWAWQWRGEPILYFTAQVPVGSRATQRERNMP